MAIYLGLGSNLGNRKENLRNALAMLAAEGVVVQRISPVVESPALLPADAPAAWNVPFLNLAVEAESKLEPRQLLASLKTIENAVGREPSARWAPRPIDIDILLFDDLQLDSDELTIPHASLLQRQFALSPLVALRPGLNLAPVGRPSVTALQASRQLGLPIPLWMGIINLTPDSFSDGGTNDNWQDVKSNIDAMLDSGVAILDFGAESTRPGAGPLGADQEWARLEPVLSRVIEYFSGDELRPLLSVDTYHPEVARRSIELGIDIVNDVSGLEQPEMIELAAERTADFVAMHNLGLPADPKKTLATDRSVIDQIDTWLDRQLASWDTAGLDLDRIIFDPGIGFGKNSLQSQELLRRIQEFRDRPLRILVGHSRKSFMSSVAGDELAARDLVTIGSSMALCQQGVEILRVHNVPDHVTAYRGWAHTQRA